MRLLANTDRSLTNRGVLHGPRAECFLPALADHAQCNVHYLESCLLIAVDLTALCRAMIHLTREFMHVAPHEKKKVQLMTGATVCHIDESALFKEQV